MRSAFSFRTRRYSVYLLAGISFASLSSSLWAQREAATTPPSQFVRNQVDAERHAKHLYLSAGVQAEVASLEAKWKQRWPALLPATLQQAHGSLEELAFLVAMETVTSDPRRPRVVQISMPPHRWSGEQFPGGRWGIDNPDTQYFLVPVEPASSYVIHGRRSPNGPADVNFSFGSLDRWNTLANIGRAQLPIAPDGSYTVTLDATPANGRPNHIQLTGEGDYVIIRNTLADWNRDTIDRMTVERTSGPPPTAVPTEEALEQLLITRLRSMLDRVIDTLQAPVFALPVNVMPQPGGSGDKAGFLLTQRNALGHFRLASDEALVITLQPGGSGYSTVPVANVWGVTPAYWRHNSSLNNRQAVPNADGSYTVVVCGWDPSLANWVDTAGLQEGIVMLRWQVLPGTPGQAGAAVRSTLVKRERLSAALPADMVVFSRNERKAQLAKREAGFARRLTER
jgi:hypothetical protein